MGDLICPHGRTAPSALNREDTTQSVPERIDQLYARQFLKPDIIDQFARVSIEEDRFWRDIRAKRGV